MAEENSFEDALNKIERELGHKLQLMLKHYNRYNASSFPLLLLYLASQQKILIRRNVPENNHRIIAIRKYPPSSEEYKEKEIYNRAVLYKNINDKELTLIEYFKKQRSLLRKSDDEAYKRTLEKEIEDTFTGNDIVNMNRIEANATFNLTRFFLKIPEEFYEKHYSALFCLVLTNIENFKQDDTSGRYFLLSAETLHEIAKIIESKIEDKEDTIWDPYAGPGYMGHVLSYQGKYIGSCYERLSYMIGRLFFENKLFKHREQVEWNYKKEEESTLYTNIVCNCAADLYRWEKVMTESAMARTLKGCYRNLKEGGTAIYLLNTRISIDWEANSFLLETAKKKELQEVIYVDTDLCLLIVRKGPNEDKRYIKFVNAIPHHNTYPNRSINAKRALKKMNDESNWTMMGYETFVQNGSDISLEHVTRLTMELEQKKNFNYVPIHNVLTLHEGKVNEGYTDLPIILTFSIADSIFDSDRLLSEVKRYNPFLPYCFATDFTKKDKKLKGYKILDKEVVFVDRIGFSPMIFNPSKGKVALPVNSYSAFDVNTELVDTEYLVNELNKPYFKKQINPLNALKEYFDEKAFMNCKVSIPDCENSIERQRQIYNYEKRDYISKLLTQFDVDLETLGNKDVNSLPEGTILDNGRYTILGLLNSGGFSMTYKAQETIELSEGGRSQRAYRIVAIKEFFMKRLQGRNANSLNVDALLSSKLEYLRKAKEKFWNEAEKISQFEDCENIVDVYRTFDENNTAYYAMEYIEGTDLAYYCSHRYANAESRYSESGIVETIDAGNEGLSEYEAIRIIRGVATAVKAMHKVKMNHLDIKPENIMITQDLRPILIDFGTASTINDSESTSLAVYSNGYTALECGSLTDFCPQTDIYSLGATLYNMLTGYQVPTAYRLANHLQQLIRKPGISDEVWKAITKAMATRIEDRPATVDDFLDMLQKKEMQDGWDGQEKKKIAGNFADENINNELHKQKMSRETYKLTLKHQAIHNGYIYYVVKEKGKSPKTAKDFSESMERYLPRFMKENMGIDVESIYDIEDMELLERIRQRIYDNPEWKEYNKRAHGSTFTSGLKYYIEFYKSNFFPTEYRDITEETKK